MTRIFVKPLLGSLILVLSAHASPKLEGKRLIETKPGQSFWATPDEIESISHRAHAEGKCGGFMDITDAPAASLVAPIGPSLLQLASREPKEQARVNPLLSQADEGNLIALVTKLSAYEDRKHNTENGEEAAKWIASEYERIASGRSDVSVELFAHDFRQPSVIATIAGNGPDKDEIVVVGGHLDSISGGAAPGADDNASGTSTVMETFRILVESGYQPNRTIQFMGYAGEERGLLGSQDIANKYRADGKVVVGALQFDMTMYPGSNPRIAFITDYVNRDLTSFVQKLNTEYVGMASIEDKCGYACSDHASWTRAGFPSAFPFETAFDEYNPSIHTPRDVVSNLDGGHGAHFLKLGIAFAIEMAEAEGVLGGGDSGDDGTGADGSSWPSAARRISRR